MQIVIRASDGQKKELLEKGFADKALIEWTAPDEKPVLAQADAFFDLVFNDNMIQENEWIPQIPVFVHAVNCSCAEISRPNYIRLNAWKGFLQRDVTELACNDEPTKIQAEGIFNTLAWKFKWTKDDYGFVAGRIIAMIINEAYYALEEDVSVKEEIDIAMKLGTNYPYGPFEWSEKIGLEDIFCLLQKLCSRDKRYTISSLLEQAAKQIR